MTEDARTLALSALEWFRRGKGAESALDIALGKNVRKARDSSLAARIFYGVLQNMALCDFYIGAFSRIKPSKMEDLALDILRIGVYQIVFLEKVPNRAAVSVCVELCRQRGLQRVCGLVNAVLRGIASGNLPEIPGRGTTGYLAIKYSHPLWLAENYVSLFGYDGAQELLSANNKPPPLTLQVNTMRSSSEALKSLLEAGGAEVKSHGWMPDCLETPGLGNLTGTSEFMSGLYFIQDAAARLAVKTAKLEPGMRVLDVCAAPGGKSFAAAVDMRGKGEIVSCDVNRKKLQKISQGADRLGYNIIAPRQMDASSPDPNFDGAFDAVICDVPCSGLGVIRKKPEIRYKKPEEFEGLPELQYRILKGAAGCVSRGGTLVYSTCTTRREENLNVVERFLEGNRGFHMDDVILQAEPEQAGKGIFELWPHLHGTDGFFICKMRRNK